jgi:hypothetical protein
VEEVAGQPRRGRVRRNWRQVISVFLVVWVPNKSSSSGDLGIFVYQPAESVVTSVTAVDDPFGTHRPTKGWRNTSRGTAKEQALSMAKELILPLADPTRVHRILDGVATSMATDLVLHALEMAM